MDLKITNFILLDVGLLESSIEINPKKIGQSKLTQFTHQVGVAHEIELNKKVLFIIVDVDLYSDDIKEVVAKFKTSIAYGFGHLNLKFDTTISKFPFSNKLTHQLTDAAISTTRGMMFMHLKGTILHRAFLPLMDFSEVEIPKKA